MAWLQKPCQPLHATALTGKHCCLSKENINNNIKVVGWRLISFEINLNLVEYKTETYLVWVLNVDTESKLLQYTTLSFDHLVFRGDVILV